MKKIISIILLTVFVIGCSEQPPVKAPCNASGSNCWPRTKINQWDTGNNN